MNKILIEWDKMTDKLAEAFVVKYFGKLKDYEMFWIGSQDEDRETLCVNDYFFNLDRIIDSLRYNATKKQLFEYYDKEIECENNEITFKNYLNKHSVK